MTDEFDIYRTIMDGEHPSGMPFFTAQALAEIHDVSRPTASKYLEKIEGRDGIRTATVGQADVYWYEPSKSEASSISEMVSESYRYFWDDLLTKRARYLDARESLRRSCKTDEQLTDRKLHFISVMDQYLFAATRGWINWDILYEDIEPDSRNWLKEPEDSVSDSDSRSVGSAKGSVSKQDIRHYAYDAYLFEPADAPPVTGLVEFQWGYHPILVDKIEDENDTIQSYEDMDDASISPLLPPGRQLIAGGDVVDELATAAHGIEW